MKVEQEPINTSTMSMQSHAFVEMLPKRGLIEDSAIRNEAISILRQKPQNSEMLYNIIYLTYVAPERMMVVEICSKLHISDRQYYRLRQQALNIIAMRLWSAPAAEPDSSMEVMRLLEVL